MPRASAKAHHLHGAEAHVSMSGGDRRGKKTHVFGEIQLDCRLSLWLSSALDQPGFLGYVCSGGPERVIAGTSLAVLRQFVAGV